MSEQARMQGIRRLTLSNFRNYQDMALTLPGGEASAVTWPVVLYGNNGAGKTNLIEALSYLAPGRGLRGSRLQDIARIGSNGSWAVAAEGESKMGPIRVGTGLVAASNPGADTGAGDRRTVRIDGESAAGPAVLSSYFSVIWLTPRMDRLFVDAQSGRRRFLDQMVLGLHPDHARHIGSYERAMRERLKLLTDSVPADATWLAALEQRMAEHGVAVAAARNEAVRHLVHQIESQPDSIFPKAGLALSGLLEGILADASALEAEEQYLLCLAEARMEDARSGRTNHGPHRTDLLVTHQPKAMPAHMCSTGEQKALLVGLVLADARLQKALGGVAPMLLLDEISAHLDDARRRSLFEELRGLGSQAWLTGTDKALFESLNGQAHFYEVQGGTLAHQE